MSNHYRDDESTVQDSDLVLTLQDDCVLCNSCNFCDADHMPTWGALAQQWMARAECTVSLSMHESEWNQWN